MHCLQKWTMWVNLFFATNCLHVFVSTFQLNLLMSISCHGQGFSGQVRWVSLFVREKLRSVSSLHGHPLLPLLFLLLLHSATTTTLGMPDNTHKLLMGNILITKILKSNKMLLLWLITSCTSKFPAHGSTCFWRKRQKSPFSLKARTFSILLWLRGDSGSGPRNYVYRSVFLK